MWCCVLFYVVFIIKAELLHLMSPPCCVRGQILRTKSYVIDWFKRRITQHITSSIFCIPYEFADGLDFDENNVSFLPAPKEHSKVELADTSNILAG